MPFKLKLFGFSTYKKYRDIKNLKMSNLVIEELDSFKAWKEAIKKMQEFVDSKSSSNDEIQDLDHLKFGSSNKVSFNEKDYMTYIQLTENVNLAKLHLDEEIEFNIRLSPPILKEKIYQMILDWYSFMEMKKKGTSVNPPIQDSISVLVDGILQIIKISNEASGSN